MLHTIRQKHILIVESGCTGTFPMLLMALDAWADMRMYTPRYEENRAFETLAAQEAYLRFDCWQDGAMRRAHLYG